MVDQQISIINAMTDPYHHIYQGEIFQQSQCIWHENTLMDFFRSQLQCLGYKAIDDSNKVWQRDNRTVVVCLADDFSTCRQHQDSRFSYQFSADTTIITDNHATVPTQYRICQLPASYFGIYSHSPSQSQWMPDRRFNFSVNRIDPKRLLLMLEIWNRTMLWQLENNLQPQDHRDYINFNCWSWQGQNTTPSALQQNFMDLWEQLDVSYHRVYQHVFDDLWSRMPWRNHDLSHELSHVRAWCNLVVETYSSDNNIALSEKTFRALCLPVPWMIYSGRHTVAYLHALGFDTLQDLFAHSYDSLIENNTAAYGDKMVVWGIEADETVAALKTRIFGDLQQRLDQAALHNQTLLHQFRQQWPQQFAQWWPAVLQHIQ